MISPMAVLQPSVFPADGHPASDEARARVHEAEAADRARYTHGSLADKRRNEPARLSTLLTNFRGGCRGDDLAERLPGHVAAMRHEAFMAALMRKQLLELRLLRRVRRVSREVLVLHRIVADVGHLVFVRIWRRLER